MEELGHGGPDDTVLMYCMYIFILILPGNSREKAAISSSFLGGRGEEAREAVIRLLPRADHQAGQLAGPLDADRGGPGPGQHPGPLGHFFRRLARKKNRNLAVTVRAKAGRQAAIPGREKDP
jgi:hypothetical protein